MSSRRSSFLTTIAAVALAATLAVGQPSFAQELQKIPGTVVSLVPAEGWTVAQGFSGLANEDTQASMVVVEMPEEAGSQIVPLFSSIDTAKAAFASQGVVVDELSSLTLDDGTEIPVITGSQQAGDITFDKWVALLADKKTVLITVQSPSEAGLDDATVETMLKSVSLADDVSIDEKVAALPFSVAATEPFRVIDTIAGSGVMMTAGPVDIDPEGKQPLMIAVMQISGPVSADQQEEIARALLLQTNSLEQAVIEKTENVSFAGGEGVLLSGKAAEGNTERRFVQYLRVGEEGRFIRLIAMAEEEGFEAVQPAIEAVAASIDFKN